MTNLDTSALSSSFAPSTPDEDNGSLPNVDPAKMLDDMAKRQRKYGALQGKAANSRPNSIMDLFDSVLNGLEYVPSKTGKKHPDAKPNCADIAHDAYAEGVKDNAKGTTSLPQRKSNYNTVARWAAGKATWEQASVRDEALIKHGEYETFNAKQTKLKDRIKVHDIFALMVRLAQKQTDPANADARLTAEQIDAAVKKDEREEKTDREKLEAAKKVVEEIYSTTRSDEPMSTLLKAFDGVLTTYVQDEARERHAAMLEELQSAGVISERVHVNLH